MILDKNSIENIINYILNNREKKISLYEKKIIFFLLKDNIRSNPEISGKLKYLGSGSHGIVIGPAILIDLLDNIKLHDKYNSKYVSKLFNNNDECKQLIYNEYLIGLKLQKIDPENNYFIYPIDYNYSSVDFSNLILKRGYSLKYEYFTEFDIYKIFFNLLNALELLINNNLCNLDIKSDNILFNKIDNCQYKSVFIDFTSELILESKKDFLEFCKQFKKYVHPYWPIEINCILNYYNNNLIFNLDNLESTEKFKQYQEKLSINDEYYLKNIHPSFVNDLDNNIKNIFEKIMIFEFGQMFLHLIENEFKDYKTKTYMKFKQFILYLIKDDYRTRYDIKEIKKNFKFNTDNYIINLKK